MNIGKRTNGGHGRWILWEREQALRNECGYGGAQPYWDYSLDVAEAGRQFNQSPIFDAKFGFGGNGAGGSVPLPSLDDGGSGFGPDLGGCLVDGPFRNINATLGPNFAFALNSRCPRRNLQPEIADVSFGWNASVVPLLNVSTYAEFVDGVNVAPANPNLPGIHVAGHIAVGGTVICLSIP
jgi:tyrosinase